MTGRKSRRRLLPDERGASSVRLRSKCKGKLPGPSAAETRQFVLLLNAFGFT
jgi:hypothetical protein